MRKILFPLIILLFPVFVFCQVTFSKVPQNKQLYARDTITNLALVEIEGNVDSSNTPYGALVVELYKNAILQTSSTITLSYNSSGIADFSYSTNINAELSNYTFEIYGVQNSVRTLITSINKVVAGDVYIIQGQSNAVAKQYSGNANSNISDFIRVFEKGLVDSNRNEWFIGQGNGKNDTDGNTGQWGLKLSRMIVDTYQIPVAIFNGARGGRNISFYLAPSDYKTSLTSNYAQLYYRLNYTNLKDKVRGIFWSQGENSERAISTYKNRFLQLKSSWQNDYPNVKHIYIFQTKIGCDLTRLHTINLMQEAQRQLADENDNISIMSTSSLSQNPNDNCHFIYNGGYEVFANRIFELVKKDFYGASSIPYVKPPMVKDIYKYGNNKLVIETDTPNLSIDSSIPEGFILENTANVNITNIEVKESKVILTYFGVIPNNKEFSYRGPDPGISGNFIKNTNGIELICFSHYPIGNGPSCSLSTSWNGTGWSNGAPNPYTTATINANYSTQNHGSITSCDCEISNNATLTISDNDYLAISGNFIINGIFDLKDDASLYMFNDDTQITYNGSSIIHKKSTPLNDSYDFTYWSSPVENDIISNVFTGVDPSRIFYWETPITGNPGYWVNSNQSDVLISGKGYISEAPVNVTQHNLTFTGRPNTGVITLNLGYDSTNGAAGGYNLIGNPYPSSIDILKFLDHSQNSFLDGTIWLWTHATPYSNGEGGSYTSSDYATFNRTGGTSNNPNVPAPQNNIASAQGFFVKALQSGTIRFDNEMRLTNQNNIFFKNNKKKSIKDRIWLNVFGQKNKHFNQILIGFSSQTTDLFDKSYDGLKFSSGYISLYSKINNDKYAIQSLGEFNQSKEVTIGFDTYQKDTYTISIGKLEGELENNDIYLYDNELNILHDLKNANYEFEAVNTGSFSDRFILKFNNTVLSNNEPNASSTVLIRQVDSSILIESPASELKSLVVYDMLGRNIFENRRINKKSLKINVSKDAINSIYIVSVTLKSGHTLNKKIIVK